MLKEEDKKYLMILEKVDNDESKARAQKEMEALFNETERRKKEISNTLRGIEVSNVFTCSLGLMVLVARELL